MRKERHKRIDFSNELTANRNAKKDKIEAA